MPDIGTPAPDFTLLDQDRQPVTLSQRLSSGPVVLAFFPAAFTPVCEKELCTFRDTMADVAGKAQVLGVSVDTSFALKAWADQHRFGFPLLSDFNKEVIAQYEVINPDMIGMKGIAKRAVFVIGQDGTIRHREVLDDARNEPNYTKLDEALANLQA